MDRGTWWATVHGVAESWTQSMGLQRVGHNLVTNTFTFTTKPRLGKKLRPTAKGGGDCDSATSIFYEILRSLLSCT